MYTTPGSLIQKGKLSKELNIIDLSGKPTGVYLLKVMNDKSVLKIFKLIKE